MNKLEVKTKILERDLEKIVTALEKDKDLKIVYESFNKVLNKIKKRKAPKPARNKIDTKIKPKEREALRDVKYIIDYYNKYVSEDSIRLSEKFRNELVKEKATPKELVFKAVLKALKIKYEFQHVIFTDYKGKFFIVDFYLPEYNVAVEIDGGYHFTDSQIIADNKRTKEILTRVRLRKIIRFKNEDVHNTEEFMRKVKGILERSGRTSVKLKDLGI